MTDYPIWTFKVGGKEKPFVEIEDFNTVVTELLNWKITASRWNDDAIKAEAERDTALEMCEKLAGALRNICANNGFDQCASEAVQAIQEFDAFKTEGDK